VVSLMQSSFPQKFYTAVIRDLNTQKRRGLQSQTAPPNRQ